MVEYNIIFSKQACKDKKLLKQNGLEKKAKDLLNIIANDPFRTPPRYEKLNGKLSGCFSRRINLQHRLVYMVNEANQEIWVLRMWTHYDKL